MCGVGILERAPGAKSSPYEEFCKNSRQYFEGWDERTTRSGTVQSPLTGHVPPVNHTRAYSVRLNECCFHPDLRIQLGRAEEPTSCFDALLTSEETPGMFCMPDEEIINGTFENRKSASGHLAPIFTIDSPPHGVGEGAYATKGLDPKQGEAATFTNGGGK